MIGAALTAPGILLTFARCVQRDSHAAGQLLVVHPEYSA